jgi:hypothetical protein
MKMNSGKRSGSRWAFGGLAVLLGTGGILTFGTPGGKQAGCGGGYFDEDTGEFIQVSQQSGEASDALKSRSAGGAVEQATRELLNDLVVGPVRNAYMATNQ